MRHLGDEPPVLALGDLQPADRCRQRVGHPVELVGPPPELVGAAARDPRGEVVAAAVVATPEVTREQVRAFCRERLSLHKVPRIVKLIERIPVDERGKIRRSALAEL